MPAPHWLRLALLAAICAAEVSALNASPAGTPVVLARGAAQRRPPPARDAAARRIEATPGGPEFLMTMTPDDVARGLGGLRALPPRDPLALADDPARARGIERGAALRQTLGELRERRRAQEVAWMERWLAVVEITGPLEVTP